MEAKIKILNINSDSEPYGGVPVFLMNIFRHINHERFQFDFLTPNTTSYGPYRDEIEKEGGTIFEFHINCDSWGGKISFGKKLKRFFEGHSYDIVHINCGAVSFDFIMAIVAKSTGTKVIVHSHNSSMKRSCWKRPVVFIMKLIMQKNADVLCACSKMAALSTFTSKEVKRGHVITIKNGISLPKFGYNEKMRKKIRQELGLEGHFVVGHVGRFVEQKNHEFLSDIFEEILKEKSNAVLLLIGEGELENHIREKVIASGIGDHVIFLGRRNDVECLYQAMDVLVFPSLFEGLPITLLEAQTSGLPCCISDSISTEVDITPLVCHITLKASAKEWAQTIIEISENSRQRCSHDKEMLEAGYSIESTVSRIAQIYEDLVKMCE